MLAVAGVANFKPGEVDPYDNEVLMPLSEFIERPEALDLLHDGQVLQVRTGRTSALPMRLTAFQHCPIKSPDDIAWSTQIQVCSVS